MKRWKRKFGVAITGIAWSIGSNASFWVHIPLALLALGLAFSLGVDAWRWVAVVLAITAVMSAELLNTSIEQLVQALHPQHDPKIGRALDIAAGAVLIAAIGAAVVGLIVLGPPLWQALL